MGGIVPSLFSPRNNDAANDSKEVESVAEEMRPRSFINLSSRTSKYSEFHGQKITPTMLKQCRKHFEEIEEDFRIRLYLHDYDMIEHIHGKKSILEIEVLRCSTGFCLDPKLYLDYVTLRTFWQIRHTTYGNEYDGLEDYICTNTIVIKKVNNLEVLLDIDMYILSKALLPDISLDRSSRGVGHRKHSSTLNKT
jgi:hypothetical protein